MKIEDGDMTSVIIRVYQVKVMWMITIAVPTTMVMPMVAMLMIVMGG